MYGGLNGDNIVNTPADQSPPANAPRIAVIGDVMIDTDVHCTCTRICQEGPWPVFKSERTKHRLGGAGNVAAMTRALGAETLLLGFVGAEASRLLHDTLLATCLVKEGPGTTKSRYWCDGKLTGPRVDCDLPARSDDCDIARFLETLAKFHADAIVIADHGKGVVTAELMRELASLDIPIFIDPVRETPAYGDSCPAAIASHSHELPAWSRADCIITKMGANGLRWSDGHHEGTCESACQNLVDPLGAGDQFIAALAYRRCLGDDWRTSIEWANVAAGIQCERNGCAPVAIGEIQVRFENPLPVAVGDSR